MSASPSTFTIIDRRGSASDNASFTARDGERPEQSQARRLGKALDWSDRQMRAIRQARLHTIRQYCGTDFGQPRMDKSQPMPMITGLVEALLPALNIEPKADVTSNQQYLDEQSPIVAARINQEIKDLGFPRTVRRWILGALFGPAWLLMDRIIQEGPGDDSDGMILRASVVPMDDAIPDMYAKRPEDRGYMAHRFVMDREWAMEQEGWDRDAIEALPTMEEEYRRETRADELQHARGNIEGRWRDQIELTSIWLPRYGKTPPRRVGLPADTTTSDSYLWDIPDDVDESDPYIPLGLMYVPDNDLPLSLAGIVSDLDEMINKIARKYLRRTENAKEVTVYTGDKTEADSVRNANDLDMLPVRDSKAYTQLQFGGPDAAMSNALQYLEGVFNMRAGNPDALGGLQKGANTLGQDQMLLGQASSKIVFWRLEIAEALTTALQIIARRAWDDDGKKVRIKATNKLGHTMRHHWGVDPAIIPQPPRGQTSDLGFEDYEIALSAYGFSGDSPERKYQRLVNALNTASPLFSMAAQQGYEVDIQSVLHDLFHGAGLDHASRYVRRVATIQPAANVGVNQIGGDTINAGGQQRALPSPMPVQSQPQEAGATQ